MDEAVEWTRIVEALVRVEDADPEVSGILAFGSEPGHGGILVERGRICWAVAPGMQRRLKDLLATFAARDEIDFDRVFERCRANGQLLGQTLVEEGWISAGELEYALRQHSAESLVELCRNDGALTWTSRKQKGYLPAFTFRPIDLLLDVVALSVPDLQALARLEIEKLARPDRRCAAFCCDDHYEVMVPVATFGELSVHELWGLGRWAMRVPLATRELGSTPVFTLAATTDGDTIALWWRGPLLYVAVCDDRSSVAALTSYHLMGDGQ